MAKSKKKGESLPSNKLIRILFPEIQILDHIKEMGIIDKNHFKKNKQRLDSTISSTKNIKANISNKINNDTSSEMKSYETAQNIGQDYNTKTSNNSKSTTRENKEGLDSKFDLVQNMLSEYVLGQSEYLPSLCRAFKRPFVYGKNDGINNTIFITGPKGSGKHLSVKAITKLLKEQKVLRRGGVHSVDLAKYNLEKDADNLFLSDLYSAICSTDDVIIFDNFEKCHQTALDIIINLVIDEKIKLNRRYTTQLGQMVDVTGKGNLNLNTTDEILINGKYLIFITEQSEENIRNKFSSNFMKKVQDIINTVKLDENSLAIVCKYILSDYKEKISKNLSIEFNYYNDVLEYIIKNFDKSIGAHGLENFIEYNIYAPLVELELMSKIDNNHGYNLRRDNDNLILENGLEKIDLSSVLERNDDNNLEELNKELENIIGLNNVKEFINKLQDNIKVQNIRKSTGSKEAKLSLHMIFTGNPGTGKTTMARIMAKYLKALGYLSSGHLVEVSRNDLVGQYVGETAQKTMSKINSAMGGILFIDEAYAIARDQNDIFGIEAVDTIVKAVEDNRSNLVVILAGYTGEMEEFLKTNSGLKSRFNYNIEFEDYTPAELLQISKKISEGNGYIIEEEVDAPLLDLFERKQIKGKNDSGNGRLARNIIEEAITNQSNRLAKLSESELNNELINKLTSNDFGLESKEELILEDELANIIGLEEVKDFIRNLEKQLIAKEKRKKIGVNVESSQSLNMIFTGNPGTGKTTVARLIGNLMKRMGVLKSGQVVEVDRSALVGQYVGETSKKTTEVFKSALGGVLFIDEAYALMSSENDPFGKESVDTLVKLIEDFREDIVVILAGYDKEMKEFLGTNSGLQSRFPLSIEFKDYSIDELVKIGKSMIASKGFVLAGNSEDELGEAIKSANQKRSSQSGNGRMVRNIIEKAIREQSARIADLDNIDENSAILLMEEDFNTQIEAINEEFDLEQKLKEVIGLEEVKDFIKSLKAQLKIREQRKSLGLPVDESQTLHMIFKGNPGTGKTTMARIIGEVLYNIGVLKNNAFVETDRSGLVAGYVGQTAIKTKEVLDSALGGILFIDEAYSLAQDAGSGSGFGKEAIDTLVKGMDDNRDNLLVILAGYSDDMDRFLDINPGLKSRFANIIEFKDYSVDNLLEIADNLFKNKGYVITSEARLKMMDIFKEASLVSDFGNGRYVRNIFEKAIRNQAVRLNEINNLTKEHLITIEASDISKVNV